MITLATRLVDRIIQARGKNQLEAMLKEARRGGGSGAKFATGGTPEELSSAVGDATASGFLSLDAVLALADELEEIGGQHVFVFRVTDAGVNSLTPARIKAMFTEAPRTVGYYSSAPAGHLTHWVTRGAETWLKQTHTAEFWEENEDVKVWTDTLRRKEWRKVRRRAVHTMVVDLATRRAEICIDRITGRDDAETALEELRAFFASTSAFMTVGIDLEPVPILGALGPIARNTRDETHMAVDRADDPSASYWMSSRREEAQGTDIRSLAKYQLASDDVDRRMLSIHWWLDAEKTRKVHTVISAVSLLVQGEPKECAKVYLGRKVSLEERAHALSRIRFFAS